MRNRTTSVVEELGKRQRSVSDLAHDLFNHTILANLNPKAVVIDPAAVGKIYVVRSPSAKGLRAWDQPGTSAANKVARFKNGTALTVIRVESPWFLVSCSAVDSVWVRHHQGNVKYLAPSTQATREMAERERSQSQLDHMSLVEQRFRSLTHTEVHVKVQGDSGTEMAVGAKTSTVPNPLDGAHQLAQERQAEEV